MNVISFKFLENPNRGVDLPYPGQVTLETFNTITSQDKPYFETPEPPPQRNLPVTVVNYLPSIRLFAS